MAHAPEDVELYVCESCQVTYAGTPTGSESDRDFEPPSACATCGDVDFVPASEWVHHHRNS